MKTKNKKILVVLLVMCLALVFVGCGFGQAANYNPDPNSVTGHIVGTILNTFQGLTSKIGLPNYCVAIFLLTLLVKLVTYPLTVKQQKNTKNMSVVQPKMKEINKRYENSPEKKQEAMMKLYKEENINPMSSCLPLLIQMPIIMVLFWGIRNFIPPDALTQFYSFFWIENLSAVVNSTPYPQVLPLLCAVTTVLQQAVSMPNFQDKTQKMMLFAMPVMFYFVSMQFPAGLCLYWMFYGLLTAIQTLFINYKLKIGLFTSAEEKAKTKAALAAGKQDKGQAAKGKKNSAETAKEKDENNQRQQVHTHTHQEEGSTKKMSDKPWQ